MKNISTFQAVLIGVFAFAALFGMFIFSTYSGSGSSAKKIGTVVIWGTLPAAPMRAALESLGQQNNDLQGVTYIAKPASTFVGDLNAAIAQGQAPDLVLLSQADLDPLASALTPIPYTALPQRTFLDNFANVCTVYLGPNGVYGVPIGIDPLMLYYNRTLLSSASIAAPPTTWEALTGLVPQITQTTSSQNVSRALIALGAYDNVHDARGVLSTLFLQAGLPIVSEDARGQYTVSLGNTQTTSAVGGVPPGESVLRFYTSFADPTEISYTWNSTLPDSQQMFLAGNEALYLGYASEGQYFAQANPNLSFDVAPVPQPQMASIKTVYANVYALAIPHGSSNPQGAYLAALALSGATADQTIASAMGFAPAQRSLLAAPPNDPTSAVVYPAAVMASTWLSPAPATTDQIFSGMIQDVITGRVSISQALTNAEQSIRASL
ncbi:MAG: hypothetical protein B7X04_03585 [Parcubacteria group bacterium 21-54-25]|nr:MAG: hypothetical protein B7X04_03585 [Parcubacteria group bacterium 21-54-25]HQU08068.1 extracellular solute-binding protein [Candidatus Paceibacterota bacterium]